MDTTGIASNPYRQYVSSYKAARLNQAAAQIEENENVEGGYFDGIKDFTYGALGIDQADEQSAEDGNLYRYGQYAKAALSVGRIVSLFA